tara:strand:+ start:383 stop:760 length:378 start_codon:yes stop_codon:yes gene_type:complete
MTQEAENVLSTKGFNPLNVFESDFSPIHKLAEFEEFLANRRTAMNSPVAKKDEFSLRAFGGNYSNSLIASEMQSNTPYQTTVGGSTNISQSDNQYPSLTNTERIKILHNVNFLNNEKKTVGTFTN